MKPPNSYKEVQKLTGCLAALNRFISKAGERNLPFFKNLRHQVRGSCGVKNEIIMRYYAKEVEISQEFKQIIFEHIPRAENEREDGLSRFARTYYSKLPEGLYVEVCDQPAYREEVIKSIVGLNSRDWSDPIIEYLVHGRLPNNNLEAKKVQN
ncbi:hypothetical protein LIER_18985 [Lithospermum erythrorhizon]|uniref:Uncharacterized protein n=1 Tax=Lithospermum erythrorhizon TaxID=34254 RepID=A0AAV3QKE2_LITER